MVLKKRDSLGQYNKFKYSLYIRGVKKINVPIEHQTEWKLILYQVAQYILFAGWGNVTEIPLKAHAV